MKLSGKIGAVVFVLIMLCVYSSKGQNDTFIKYLDSGFDDIVYSTIEVPNGDYIISSFSINKGKSVLLKINCLGELVLTNELKDRYIIYNLFPDTNGNFIGLGSVSDEMFTKNQFLLIRFDSNFNILDEKRYSVPYRIMNIKYCVDHFNNLICNIQLYNINSNDPFDLSIFRLTMNGDSLNYKHFESPNIQISNSIMEKLDHSGYYLPENGRIDPVCSPYLNNMIELDYDFSITFEDSITNDIGLHTTMRKFNDSQYLISGNKYIPFTPYENEFIALEKLDATYQAYAYSTIGPLMVDTITYPAWFRSLDFIDTNNIFVGGTVNFNLNQIPDRKSYFILTNLDSELNKRWQYFYGFDRYYEMSGILATSDGGCLLYGTYCNYTNPATNVKDIILIKVDSSGLVTGIPHNPDFIISSAILFPNPGREQLNIQSGPQINGAAFTLYDMQGRPVLEENINATQLRLNTSNLVSGTYPWQIVFKNNVIESGKWVKP